MPKRSDNDTLPLFPDMSFKSLDERQYEAKQESKKKAKKLIRISPAPASGPACLRCRHWVKPQDANDFGICRALGVAESSSPFGGVDKGVILPRIDAQKIHRVAAEPLHTREGFHCSAYQEAQEEAA